MPRYRTAAEFAAAHADIYAFLERRQNAGEEVEFLNAMWRKIQGGESLSPNMMTGLHKWCRSTRPTEFSPRPEEAASYIAEDVRMPVVGERILVGVLVTASERKEGKTGVVETWKFAETANGWHGRIESRSVELEDQMTALGAPPNAGQYAAPVRLEVVADVKWIADRRAYVILGGAVSVREAPEDEIAPARVLEAATPAESSIARRRRLGTPAREKVSETKAQDREAAADSRIVVADDAWRNAFKL